MAWVDTKVLLTNNQFKTECDNCRIYCQEAKISIPCGGDKFRCPYYNEIDSDDYDKEIRNKAIDNFAEKLKKELTALEEQYGNMALAYNDSHKTYEYVGREQTVSLITQIANGIAEQLKGGVGMTESEKTLEEKIEFIKKMQKNTIDDRYDTGFYNGIEFCLSVFENREAEYRKWRTERR